MLTTWAVGLFLALTLVAVAALVASYRQFNQPADKLGPLMTLPASVDLLAEPHGGQASCVENDLPVQQLNGECPASAPGPPHPSPQHCPLDVHRLNVGHLRGVSMLRQVRCECGYIARGRTDYEVIALILAHVARDIPPVQTTTQPTVDPAAANPGPAVTERVDELKVDPAAAGQAPWMALRSLGDMELMIASIRSGTGKVDAERADPVAADTQQADTHNADPTAAEPAAAEQEDTQQPDPTTAEPAAAEQEDTQQPDPTTAEPAAAEQEDTQQPDPTTAEPAAAEQEDTQQPDPTTAEPAAAEQEDTQQPTRRQPNQRQPNRRPPSKKTPNSPTQRQPNRRQPNRRPPSKKTPNRPTRRLPNPR